jgi:succinyl-CoA synthetase beta subunit
MDIEEIARRYPDKIIKLAIHPFLGLRDYQTRDLASAIDLPHIYWKQFLEISRGLWQVYRDLDATLAEINPLVVSADSLLVALDAKINIDDNALFRHTELNEYRDFDIEDVSETEARKYGMSYIKLNGKIGCLVNGAGLAMTVMDMVKYYGGRPANFLDIGGGASAEKVAVAMQILLNDPSVITIMVNIFGGITRCDEVAKGILTAVADEKKHVPIVARLVGTHAQIGKKLLHEANISTLDSLTETAKFAVEQSQSTGRKQ